MKVRGLQIAAALSCAVVLLTPAARAADRQAVKQAIDRGVAWLKKQQQDDGSWPYMSKGHIPGATALAGLTLLECGVPADDPAVQKAADLVRKQGPTFDQTYLLSLGIMFLDRLGDDRDGEVIKTMAGRLLVGQDPASGGWTYGCRAASAEEGNRRGPGNLPKPEEPPKPKDVPGQPEQGPKGQFTKSIGADNSNTQFAILALWIARRRGIPVEEALARAETRFRGSQNPDGGWSYKVPGTRPTPQPGGQPGPMPGDWYTTPSMTCAGLLGLAFGHGSASEAVLRTQGKDKEPPRDAKGQAPADPGKDLVIRAGLAALGSALGHAGSRSGNSLYMFVNPQTKGIDYYALWMLERVAVAYGLETIGGKDWYGWGAEILLANQQPGGNWDKGIYTPGAVPLIDTCFALLFLRRANLSEDLSAILKSKVKDPGQREMRAVGSEDLQKKLTPGGENKPEPPAGEPTDKPRPGGTSKVSGEAGRLSAELVDAPEAKREEVLKRLRDSKGGEYTDALADAIPRITGELKTKARDALAERLARMTASTLKDKLRDDDLEVRRAAALAVAMKEEKPLVPRLIELLDDPEPPVSRAAHAALKNLSGQDFGPGPEASRAERAQAVTAWKDWWAKQGD
jgi:hypothetical protein